MTRRETVRAKGTHQLETRGKDLSVYTKKQPTEGHFPSRYRKGRDLSEHVKKPTGRGTPTNWRPQKEGLIRTRKIKRLSEGNELPEDRRGRDLSGHGKKATERHSRSGDRRRWDLSMHGKIAKERGALTLWRPQFCHDFERKTETKGHSPTGGGREKKLSGME